MPVHQGTKEYELTMIEYRKQTQKKIEEYRKRIRKIRQLERVNA